MKRLFLYIIIIFLLFININDVLGQVSSTAASIGIDGKVIAPISISNTGSTHLDFGTVSRSSVSGSVTIAPDGQRTSAGGVSILSSSLYSAAPFSVSGENNAGFNIALPGDNDIVLTRTSGSEKMKVTNFTHNSGLILSATGAAIFSVGATLHLDADQVAGDYTGSFSVTVAYQ